MNKGTAFGRKAREEAWQSAEVDALYRLAAAGVRVPKPYNFLEGVLLMELVVDADGNAAPRLNDVAFTADEARRHHRTLLDEVIRMLRAGVIHGDLSEFNILVAADGPGHHRPAAGGRCGRQQPREGDARARRDEPRQLLRPLRAGTDRHANTARSCGSSMSAACSTSACR